MTVSQGSAAMSLRCGWDMQWSFYTKFCAESSSERILKIAKLSTRVGCLVFLTHTV